MRPGSIRFKGIQTVIGELEIMNFSTELISHSRLVPTCNHHAEGAIAWARLSGYLAAVVGKLRNLAPYAAIALVLPGGSLIALLLRLYRRRHMTGGSSNPHGRHVTSIY